MFGANMILASTIEKNFTIKKNPIFEQKPFNKNKVRGGKDLKYIVLSNLQTDEIQNNFEKSRNFNNVTKNFMKNQTPRYSERDIGITAVSTTKADTIDKEILDITLPKSLGEEKNHYFDIWNSLTTKGHSPKTPSNHEPHRFSSHVLPTTISRYETPPAPPSTYFDFPEENPVKEHSIQDLKNSTPHKEHKVLPTKPTDEISEVETPPPTDKNNKVYGQWTSSKFAGTVLNYLKSINFRGKPSRKIPATIPITKYSDAYPYASEITINKLRPPSQFRGRNLIEKRYDVIKRDPQINLQILEKDLRSNIIKMHAQTQPKNVEINSRGEGKKRLEHRFYRSANSEASEKEPNFDEMYRQPRPFTLFSNKKNIIRDFSGPNIPNQKYKSVLPFLKSLEYTVESQNTDQTATTNNDMYSKSLKANKWHNVKSYNNDYTPRKINMDPESSKNDSLKRHPTIRLKYKPEDRRVVEDKDPSIIKGRKLAMEVSNQSDVNKDTVSIFKYNHGYIATHEKEADKTERKNSKRTRNLKNFNKQIKLGNLLNENYLIGNDNHKEKKQRLIDEKFPKLNRFRTDMEIEKILVRPSIGPRVCKNVELYDRVLYVQQDESIDMTHILSPVRAKNIAIEFIMQNYKKCSLKDSKLEVDPKLFIDWSKTPVRLFGGARPRTTTDLCGFF